MTTARTTPRRTSRFLRGLAWGLGLLVVAVPAAAINVGARAPEFSLPALAGGRLTLSGLRGKVVLLDFWASWCEPCRQEFPVLDRLQRLYEPRGLTVVGVSVDRELANIRRFLSRTPAAFAIVHDASGRAAAAYSPERMPSSFLIDRNGVVRYVQAGFEPSDAERLEQHVRRVLGL